MNESNIQHRNHTIDAYEVYSADHIVTFYGLLCL